MTQAKFLSRVLLEPISEAGALPQWRVARAFQFYSAKQDKSYSVHRGFRTDLASVPRWIPIAWALAGGTGNAAAVLHDYLYRHGLFTGQVENRAEADAVFLEAMEVTGVPIWRRRLMYLGVRVGGRSSFNKRVNFRHVWAPWKRK